MVTNADNAANYKIVTCPSTNLRRELWTDLVPHRCALRRLYWRCWIESAAFTLTITGRSSEHVAVRDADVFQGSAVLQVCDSSVRLCFCMAATCCAGSKLIWLRQGACGLEIVPLDNLGSSRAPPRRTLVALPETERGNPIMAHANADPGARDFRFSTSGPLTPLNQWSLELQV
jgi:hypothetical protein